MSSPEPAVIILIPSSPTSSRSKVAEARSIFSKLTRVSLSSCSRSSAKPEKFEVKSKLLPLNNPIQFIIESQQ